MPEWTKLLSQINDMGRQAAVGGKEKEECERVGDNNSVFVTKLIETCDLAQIIYWPQMPFLET